MTQIEILRQAIEEAIRYCESKPTALTFEGKQEELFLLRKGLAEVLKKMLAQADAEAAKPAKLVDYAAGLVFAVEGVSDPSVLFTLVRAGKVAGRVAEYSETETDPVTATLIDGLLDDLATQRAPVRLSPGRLEELRQRYAAEAKGQDYDPTKWLDNEDPRR